MRSSLAIAVLVLLSLGQGLAAQECVVQDTTPDFWRFWEEARDLPEAKQVELFDARVRARHAAVYAAIFKGLPMSPEVLLRQGLAQVPKHEAALRRLSDQIRDGLPGQIQRFRAAFPDFRCAVPIHVVYSAGAFDGAVRQVEGKPALLFGIDVIARMGSELGPLVLHELFHVHHGEVAADPGTVGWALWKEGLASHVSGRLSGASESQVFGLPPAAPIDAILPRIAGELERQLDSEDAEVYARFFLGGSELDIPRRSGYLLGYRIAAAMGRTRTLAELARLPADVVRPELSAALTRMARPPR